MYRKRRAQGEAGWNVSRCPSLDRYDEQKKTGVMPDSDRAKCFHSEIFCADRPPTGACDRLITRLPIRGT